MDKKAQLLTQDHSAVFTKINAQTTPQKIKAHSPYDIISNQNQTGGLFDTVATTTNQEKTPVKRRTTVTTVKRKMREAKCDLMPFIFLVHIRCFKVYDL